jgi:N-acetylmuramoyl-L-alanine amidase
MKRIMTLVFSGVCLAAALVWLIGLIFARPVTQTASDLITVVIDAGHGGTDGGKSGTIKNEAYINLEIALILKDLLVEKGFNVVLTRTDDQGLCVEGQSWDKDEDMRLRKQIVLCSNADMLISIHQNSFTDSRVRGAQVFYSTVLDENKTLADMIRNNLLELSEYNDRILLTADDLKILKENPMPSVLVECGFLSNPYDEQLLNDPDYQTKLADAIYRAVCEFFSLSP